ncbi:hypothetical protein DL764_008833 [Monosporascus ibericus]|uniref:Uncharacterized protein n=1 Tax=Monosporascus ibericus TaxID=155417 RepID=A0A4Q4SWH1_9PEZI|nr:hypothetical protein DL764_008833 [Monosporascus ibericus]
MLRLLTILMCLCAPLQAIPPLGRKAAAPTRSQFIPGRGVPWIDEIPSRRIERFKRDPGITDIARHASHEERAEPDDITCSDLPPAKLPMRAALSTCSTFLKTIGESFCQAKHEPTNWCTLTVWGDPAVIWGSTYGKRKTGASKCKDVAAGIDQILEKCCDDKERCGGWGPAWGNGDILITLGNSEVPHAYKLAANESV